MPKTSARLLSLLSLLQARRDWPSELLAERLGVSPRTVRRDVDRLRELGYPIAASKGPDGGYRLGAGSELPPLLFDDDQALAIAVALQTAPSTVFGLGEDAARALDTLTHAMPARVRAAMESLQLTRLPNYWEFPAPPLDPDALRTVGAAVRHRHRLAVELLRADGSRPDPRDADFSPPRQVEPHHLVVWAGRWYVIVYDLAAGAWRVHRVDRLRTRTSAGTPFAPRDLPGDDVARFVMTSHDRGDTPAAWPCTGTALLNLPAEVVARWAPGGSVVEHLDHEYCRLSLGAWSWAGVAGLLATFDTDLADVHPPELVDACHRLAHRWRNVGHA